MYTLVDAQAMAEQNPISFTVPEDSQLDNLKIGDFAKLCFNEKERLWVFITEIDGDKFKGTIDNEPMCFPELHYMDEVEFERKNIYQVLRKPSADQIVSG